MSKRRKDAASGVMLDLWRPPQDAGDPLGCLATTYTFAPSLFDERCLARFLEIESEPDREDLAFLLERESRLGGVYAGVLVDHSQAGVEHSLRWDVLPVRIRGGKQHAKLSLLAWHSLVRVIVTSANLTEQGYRTNHEVAATIDFTPQETRAELLEEALRFLRALLEFVPAAADGTPAVGRAQSFLEQVRRRVRTWQPARGRQPIRQHLVFTTPASGSGTVASGSLDGAIRLCRARGGAPSDITVASPFFDGDSDTGTLTAALCRSMARGKDRSRVLRFCIPVIEDDQARVPRLAAPPSLLTTANRYVDELSFEALPDRDADKNLRIWHAKMIGFRSDRYSAVMIGSSNFTTAGMGTGSRANAEANLLTIVDRVDFSRDPNRLDSVWPAMEPIPDPESAEWRGAEPDREEEEQAASPPAPPGFLAAVYRAGDRRQIVLQLEPGQLPEAWSVHTSGRDGQDLLSSSSWKARGRAQSIQVEWAPVQPPEKLIVRWADHEAFLPLNVEDQRELPPPAQLDQMTADDMLGILAASDPSAAFRAWVRQHHSGSAEDDLDAAVPVDLDPLRRFDLQATFLHRVRRRARVLAQLRANLQRPVGGRQALEWRLRGLIGIEPLAERLVHDITKADGAADEALLTLADFLIVLREVDYQPADGGLPQKDFDATFRPFLRDLAQQLGGRVEAERARLSSDVLQFWTRVVERCRE